MSNILSAELRCFCHVTRIYARNLPLNVAGAIEVNADRGVGDLSETNSATTDGVSRRSTQTTWKQRCVSSYFVLSLLQGFAGGAGARGNRCIYKSEVRKETQHPVWDYIPEDITKEFGGITEFVFSLYYCTTHPEQAIAAPDTDFLLYEMLMQTSHVRFVAASMTKADTLPIRMSHIDNGPNSFVVLLNCVDGVFFPMHQGAVVDEEASKVTFLNQSRSYDAGVSSQPELVDMDTMQLHSNYPLSGVERMTVGDLKICTTAMLAWSYLGEVANARRAELQDRIDNTMEAQREEATVVAQQAMLEASLIKSHEQLRSRMCRLYQLRERYCKEHREIMLQQQARQNDLVSSNCMHNSAKEEVAFGLNEKDISFSRLSTALGNVRQLRIKELRAIFPVSVGGNGVADSICGNILPGVGNEAGVTADIMRGWALALGSAAHLVATSATIYGCVLPHPILLCGARSAMIVRPGLHLSTVMTAATAPTDPTLPLYCTRAADQPLMKAAIQLLLKDIAVLANAMNKHDVAASVLGNEPRLGEILNRLTSFE